MRVALGQEHQLESGVSVIPNARRRPQSDAPGQSHPGGRPGFHGRDALVLTAGRLWDEGKNVRALCAAAPSLPWPVYVAGDNAAAGRDPEPLPNVRHLGQLNAGSMDAWLSRAAIYALPARYEPFGLSVLEAAMAGCALVLGDIPSLRENWEEAAVFVPPGDIPAITRALRDLIDDEAARQSLALRARERAGRFTPDRMTRDYLQVYTEATAMVPA
jgi:glycosyltransferase involved in cell wall biosynthesis